MALPEAVCLQGAPGHVVAVDWLALWLTNLSLPLHGEALGDVASAGACTALSDTLAAANGPVLLVSNEIGLGAHAHDARGMPFRRRKGPFAPGRCGRLRVGNLDGGGHRSTGEAG